MLSCLNIMTYKSSILLVCLLLLCSCSDDPGFKGKGIHNYFCSSGRMRLGGGLRNASGLAFNNDTGSLFLVQDSPPWIHEVSKNGKILRTMEIENANDTESITYLGNNLFAILEESSSMVYICKIDSRTKQ